MYFLLFLFSEYKRVQTIKLIVSPKIAFGVVFLTILYYFGFFLSRNQLSHETYIDYQTTQTGSRTTVKSKMELFVNIFGIFYFLTIVTKSSILDGDRHFLLA